MLPRIVLTVLALAVVAGGQAPPETEQALRTRVDEFFRYHVEGGASLRKAMDIVAEDTKDIYFAAGKPQVLRYEIGAFEYNEDFTRATVTVKVARNYTIAGQILEMFQPLPTLWKIEDGKWMWYVDPSQQGGTPMSQAAPQSAGAAAPVSAAKPPDLEKPEAVAALAESILRFSGSLDRENVAFRWGQASEERVVFLNGYPGVELELGWVPEIPGLSVRLEKKALSAGENGVVRLTYAPPAGLDAAKQRPASFTLQLTVEPFGQVFRALVNFNSADAPAGN